MNYEERNELFMEMRKKRVSQTSAAKHLGITTSWLCQFFGSKQVNMSDDHVRQLKEYVASK